jgi:hypothetical protein
MRRERDRGIRGLTSNTAIGEPEDELGKEWDIREGISTEDID